MAPAISVIIPVFNTEDYLDRCIQSVADQSFTELEIILVDDGSNDRSMEICRKWAEKDRRIKAIRKENGGPGSARNLGISAAQGRYIGFVDSDDCIDKDMYSLLFKCMIDYKCEAAACGMVRFTDYDTIPEPCGTGAITVLQGEKIIEDFLRETHLQSTVPNILVDASVAKQVRFDEGVFHEDILWPYRIFKRIDRIVYVDQCCYFYYQRHDSTMNSAYSLKRFDALDALEKRAQEVKTDYPWLYGLAVKAYLGACMYHYQFLCRQEETSEYKEYKRILHTRFLKGDRAVLLKASNLKYRIWYTLFRTMPAVACGVRNLLKIGL